MKPNMRCNAKIAMKLLQSLLPVRARAIFAISVGATAHGRVVPLQRSRRGGGSAIVGRIGVMTILGLASALALTFTVREFTCPIDGHVFSQSVSATGTSYGSRLDNKPLGQIVAPWVLPQCPKCRFVLAWKSNDTAVVTKLRPFVLSFAYQNMASNGPTYECLARLRQTLDAPPLEIADAYLQASWQVEASPARCQTFLQAALTNQLAGIKTFAGADSDRVCLERLCGELERRLGRFDEARARLLKLRMTTTDGEVLAILDRQLRFIDQQDSAPHASTEKLERLVSRRR